MRHSAAWLANRMATGVPVPSPQLKVDPVAVVTWRVPVRISLWHTARSNRSIGLLHRLNIVSRACDALGGAAANRRLAARSFSRWRIRTNSAECRNALAPSQARQDGLPRSRAASSFGQKWQARDRVGSALAEIPRVANSSIDIMRYRGSRRRRDSFVGASPSEPRPRKVGGTNLRGHLQCMPSHSAGNQA